MRDLLAGLDAHAQRLAGESLAGLIQANPARAQDFALRCGPLYANFARQRYDHAALDALFDIAQQAGLAGAMQGLLGGETVNPTEDRAALHSALRGALQGGAAASAFVLAARAQAVSAQLRMRELIEALTATDVTVSYTHLDVYKRQTNIYQPTSAPWRPRFISSGWPVVRRV